MKKITALFMAALMIASSALFTACGEAAVEETTTEDTTVAEETTEAPAEEAALKLGLGVDIAAQATDATEDKNGNGQATVTVAAVLLDEEGKIVKCVIDCADSKAEYTAEGKAVAAAEFKTKYELGDSYSMKTYGGAALEWYEQADAFAALVAGKTADEVKALLAADNKGNDDVISAGCTITVDTFVKAIDKAIANAAESAATAADTLKIAVYTEQTTKDATDEADGSNQLESTVFAAAIDADGKITAAVSDCAQIKFTFDIAGASTYDAAKAVSTKKEQGDSYGMKAYGGAALEWYEQAAAFDAACIAKTPADVAGVDAAAAGCTIVVDAFVKAAAKLG